MACVSKRMSILSLGFIYDVPSAPAFFWMGAALHTVLSLSPTSLQLSRDLICCSRVINMDRTGEERAVTKREASLYETQLYWLWHTWWPRGSESILSHTPIFKPFPEARPNKASGKGPCSGMVGQRSNASLKNNRKHMWRARYREGLQSSQEPGSQDWDPTWPCEFPLTLPYPLHWGKGRGRGTISVLSSATGSSLAAEKGMEAVRGKDDGCFCPSHGKGRL